MTEIYLFKMLESRSLEVNALNIECKTKAPKLSSQRLPRFMRRRASSHNPKRVPKSIRQSVIKKLNETKTKSKTKKKNKKKFVNKKKLETSIKNRNHRKDRTVLHVWFAKRFKMELYWNCLLPKNNTTKNSRILYNSSKNDCVFYYLAFCQCIQIDYSLSNREHLINYLSHFTHSDIGCGFGAKIYEMANREGITVLYDYDSYPFDAITSCYFLWNQSFSKLWLWVHISVYDQVFERLTHRMTDSTYFKFNRRNGQLERFRLIGPKAHELLSNCFKFNFIEIFNSDPTTTQTVHYFRFNETNPSLINYNECNLFKDVTHNNERSLEYDFLIILKNNAFNKRFSTDIIVLSESAKQLWHSITKNRSHKVGGIRDIEMIALNTSSLLFPKIGFTDITANKEKLKALRDVSESEKPFYVLRNEAIVSKLTKNINSLSSINSILNAIKYKNLALLNVEVICVNRGVPQELDSILIPTENEIKNSVNSLTDVRKTAEDVSDENDSNSNREPIGLIEFGAYSMEISRGKALGFITIAGFEELIKIRDKVSINKFYKNNIFASIKSLKSSKYRIVTLKVIDSVISA
jgi:hypothetical protein